MIYIFSMGLMDSEDESEYQKVRVNTSYSITLQE